jgi:glycosyltransferase involved in cell wall biosynthesis
MPETPAFSAKITVVTVVYNGARDIARTIESTLSQDYPQMEYVVVDGQSTDGTQDIVAAYGAAIDAFVCEPDSGIYDAMNKAIAIASGEYLLFMNCGDRFASPHALSSAARALVAGSDQVVFGCWEREAGERRIPCRPALQAGLFNHQATLYSRSLHRRFGGYVSVPGFTTADYLFFMTLVSSGSVDCVSMDTSIAVIDVGGVSAGPQTLSQKYAIDYLLGRTTRLKLLSVLAAHPAYRRVKTLLGRRR